MSSEKRPDHQTESAQMLTRIADALDMPLVGFFQQGATPVTETQTLELLTLWTSIKSAPDRAKILSAFQALAAAQLN